MAGPQVSLTVLMTAGFAGSATAMFAVLRRWRVGGPFTIDFYKNDLAGFVVPSSLMLFHTAASAAQAQRYQGQLPEYLGYLGWPLIVHLVAKAVWSWRRLPVRACALTRAVLATFSLGDTLLAGGHEHAAVKLLWSWPQSLPLLSAVLPARFSVLANGAAGAMLAFCADAAGPALSAAEVPQSYIRAMTVPQTRMRAHTATWRVAAVVAVTDRDSVLRCYLIDLLGPPCQVIGDVLAWRTQHRR